MWYWGACGHLDSLGIVYPRKVCHFIRCVLSMPKRMTGRALQTPKPTRVKPLCRVGLRESWQKHYSINCSMSCLVHGIIHISYFIIQHIDKLPKYGKKLSMYVGPHDVYPTIDVNFSILTRECKNKKLVDNIFSSNFVLLSMC